MVPTVITPRYAVQQDMQVVALRKELIARRSLRSGDSGVEEKRGGYVANGNMADADAQKETVFRAVR